MRFHFSGWCFATDGEQSKVDGVDIEIFSRIRFVDTSLVHDSLALPYIEMPSPDLNPKMSESNTSYISGSGVELAACRKKCPNFS